MIKYTCIAEIEGKRTVLTLESQCYIEKRYQVKACDLILGYIYPVKGLQYGTIWKSTSLNFNGFNRGNKIGDSIENLRAIIRDDYTNRYATFYGIHDPAFRNFQLRHFSGRI